MIKITKTKASRASRFPETSELHEFTDFGSFLSTLSVNALMGCPGLPDDSSVLELGDSGIHIHLESTGNRQENGIREFTEAAHALKDLIQEAIPLISDTCYQDFYQRMLDDFDANGLTMPFYGKLV